MRCHHDERTGRWVPAGREVPGREPVGREPAGRVPAQRPHRFTPFRGSFPASRGITFAPDMSVPRRDPEWAATRVNDRDGGRSLVCARVDPSGRPPGAGELAGERPERQPHRHRVDQQALQGARAAGSRHATSPAGTIQRTLSSGKPRGGRGQPGTRAVAHDVEAGVSQLGAAGRRAGTKSIDRRVGVAATGLSSSPRGRGPTTLGRQACCGEVSRAGRGLPRAPRVCRTRRRVPAARARSGGCAFTVAADLGGVGSRGPPSSEPLDGGAELVVGSRARSQCEPEPRTRRGNDVPAAGRRVYCGPAPSVRRSKGGSEASTAWREARCQGHVYIILSAPSPAPHVYRRDRQRAEWTRNPKTTSVDLVRDALDVRRVKRADTPRQQTADLLTKGMTGWTTLPSAAVSPTGAPVAGCPNRSLLIGRVVRQAGVE